MPDDLLSALGRQQRRDDEARIEAEPLHAPIEGDEQSQLLDRMMDAVQQESPPPESSVPDNVVALPWWRRRGFVAAAAAVAAVALVWVFARPGPQDLPPFGVTSIEGGDALVRGVDDPEPTLTLKSDHDRIDWRFAPQRPVSQTLDVALLAQSADGRQVFARASGAEVSASGSVRLQGPLRSHIELGPGPWVVQVLFADRGGLPTDAQAASAEGDWETVSVRVVITNP